LYFQETWAVKYHGIAYRVVLSRVMGSKIPWNSL
jgi:hypothetical protein